MAATHEDPPVRSTSASCGVVGRGRMGAGIVHALLLAGAQVVLGRRTSDAAMTLGYGFPMGPLRGTVTRTGRIVQ